MPRRKSRHTRNPGRPTLLDKDVEDKLVEATTIGAPMSVAAAYVGIAERTFQEWMARGREEEMNVAEGQEPKPVEQKYMELYQRVMKARASAAVNATLLIRKAAIGGQVTEETTRRFRDADGQVVEEKTVKKQPSDWRASAWYLERQHANHFGKQTQVTHAHEHSGEVGVRVEAEALADKVARNIAELQAAQPQQLTDGTEQIVLDAEVLPDTP